MNAVTVLTDPPVIRLNVPPLTTPQNVDDVPVDAVPARLSWLDKYVFKSSLIDDVPPLNWVYGV